MLCNGKGLLGAGVESQVPGDGRGGTGTAGDVILRGCRNVSLVSFTGLPFVFVFCFFFLLSGILTYMTVWRIWL